MLKARGISVPVVVVIVTAAGAFCEREDEVVDVVNACDVAKCRNSLV